MKKNLRIASAAAAALLAVAPVAASAVSVNAAVSAADKNTLSSEVVLDRTTNTQFTAKLSNEQKTELLKSVFSDEKGVDISSLNLEATVVAATAPDTTGKFQQTLALTITKKDGTAFGSGHGLTLSADKKSLTGAQATVTARFAAQQGVPYFFSIDMDKDGKPTGTRTQLNDGSLFKLSDSFANGFSATDLLNEVHNKLGAKTSDAVDNHATITNTSSDIESQLVAQGLKRASNGNFEYPANGFNLKLTAQADNGKTASITVRVNVDVNYNAPVFVVNGQVYQNGNLVPTTSTDLAKVLNVPTNGKFDSAALLKQVTAYVQSADKDAAKGYDTTADELAKHQELVNPSKVSVDSSAVNTAVPGLYTVVVSATNPAGFTSKVYFTVVVGTAGSILEYAKADTTVYSINGNVVTATTDSLKKDASVETFGKVTVNGVEYTRIKSKDSNLFVKSADLTLTAPVAQTEVTTTKTIWHVAKIYDKDGKATSEASLHAYNTVSVVSTPVTINGAKYYKLAGKDQYVKAGNIDGTSRTLSHNAYVYKNTGKAKTTKSGKKTKKVVLKKGSQVTTYGSAFTVNGHKMFRIGRNQYVKVANF